MTIDWLHSYDRKIRTETVILSIDDLYCLNYISKKVLRHYNTANYFIYVY